jgi:hypothetical protein
MAPSYSLSEEHAASTAEAALPTNIVDTKGEGGELQVTSRLASGTVANTLGDDAGDTGLMPWETAFCSPDVLRDNMGDI